MEIPANGIWVKLVCRTPHCPANGLVCDAEIFPDHIGEDGYAECHHCKMHPAFVTEERENAQ